MIGRVGFLALARPTFDVPFARESARDALAAIRVIVEDISGDAELAMQPEIAAQRAADVTAEDVDAVVVLQATFADSSLVTAVAKVVKCPMVLWAVPEDESGGRLRLNSLCGINLAAYVLARAGTDYRWVFRDPRDPRLTMELLGAIESAASPAAQAVRPPVKDGGHSLSLAGATIGLVGERPDGFEPCDYEPEQLRSITGVNVDRVELAEWFDAGEAAAAPQVISLRNRASESMSGLDDVDQDSVDRSLRLAIGLEQMALARGWSGVATRCWPECFTDFGGAACFGNSMMSSLGRPGCCEADVYGSVTAVLLQKLADLPPFVADLVGLDLDDNTATFWHCGNAAPELAGETSPTATVHSNRQKPLLNEFPLRPGPITIARLSQARNEIRMVLGFGEMLDRPLPFSGTSGVARLESGAKRVLDVIMSNGLEHHYGIAYGDHRDELTHYAASVGISIVSL